MTAACEVPIATDLIGVAFRGEDRTGIKMSTSSTCSFSSRASLLYLAITKYNIGLFKSFQVYIVGLQSDMKPHTDQADLLNEEYTFVCEKCKSRKSALL